MIIPESGDTFDIHGNYLIFENIGIIDLILNRGKLVEGENKENETTVKSYEHFDNEHNVIKNDKRFCFKFECCDNKNQDYIDTIISIKLYNDINKNKKKHKIKLFGKQEDQFNLNSIFHYIFIGDILGNVSIFKNEIKPEKKENKNNNISNNPNKYKMIKMIYYNFH